MKNECFAVYDFSVLRLKIAYNDHAITAVTRTDEPAHGTASPLCEKAACQLREYFAGKRKAFDIPIEAHGTAFQEKVWAALRDIPYGETRSYGDIARAIGNEKACRAVGGANNKNPVCILIPCHRVVGVNGAMVGYGGGLDMKTLLLELEHENS